MAVIRDLWSLLRGPKARFGPRGPASCEQPAPPQRRAFPGTASPVPGLDFEPPAAPPADLALLRSEGEKVLRAARARGQAPALAVLQIDDLPELELVFGRAAVDEVMAAVTAGLSRTAVGRGLVARTAADTFALLMPGGGAGAAIAALQARFGKPCTIEIAFGRDDILVVPDVMVHALAPHETVAQAYDDLCRYIAKARKHGRRVCDGAPRRAACGSLGTGSPAAAATGASAPQYCPPWPETIPVPLAFH